MVLTKKEIKALNAARDVLESIADRAQDAGYEKAKEAYEYGAAGEAVAFGRLAQVAGDAESAVFRVMNVARSYAHLAIEDDDLHNRKAEAVTA